MLRETNYDQPSSGRQTPEGSSLDRKATTAIVELGLADYNRVDLAGESSELDEEEATLEDVEQFIVTPARLPTNKLASVGENYGHISDVAWRLAPRLDCPSKTISTVIRLCGCDPSFALTVINVRKGRLAPADNDRLYQYHRQDWTLVVALAQNQSLPDLAEQIYEDHGANLQVVLALLEHQESLPKPLIQRIYEDYSQQPEVLLALVAYQQLPGDLTWQAYREYGQSPEFERALFEGQKDLGEDLVLHAFEGYDRSFKLAAERIMVVESDRADFAIQIAKLLIDESGVVGNRFASESSDQEPGDPISSMTVRQVCEAASNFVDFVVCLIRHNQLSPDTIRQIYDEVGGSLVVVMALGIYQTVPEDIQQRAHQDHGDLWEVA